MISVAGSGWPFCLQWRPHQTQILQIRSELWSAHPLRLSFELMATTGKRSGGRKHTQAPTWTNAHTLQGHATASSQLRLLQVTYRHGPTNTVVSIFKQWPIPIGGVRHIKCFWHMCLKIDFNHLWIYSLTMLQNGYQTNCNTHLPKMLVLIRKCFNYLFGYQRAQISLFLWSAVKSPAHTPRAWAIGWIYRLSAIGRAANLVDCHLENSIW